jgi:hypothetical protein
MPEWLLPLIGRWYSFLPWAVVGALVWRKFGWRRAAVLLIGGWAIAFAAEWASTAGPGIPFGVYHYRAAGLRHDWTVLGIPIFDSISFTWLSFCTYSLVGALGARGSRRLVLGAVAMVAIDLAVDPVALRGASWWLGSIYRYPTGGPSWYGVTLLNYLGWLVVGAALQLWLRLCLSEFPGSQRWSFWPSAVLLLGVMAQSTALAFMFGVGPSALTGLLLLAVCGLFALLGRSRRVAGTPLIVACALASEARAVRAAVGRGWTRLPGALPVRWVAEAALLEVWETGLGLAAAGAAATRAPSDALILVAGVAGACSDGWRATEVGVGRTVMLADGRWMELSPDARARLEEANLARGCSLATVAEEVDTAKERYRLAEQGVDLAEMETAGWTRRTGARVAALRVVLDTPAEPLGVSAGLVRPGQRGPDPFLLLRLLLRRPGAIGELLALGRLQRRALFALGGAVSAAASELQRAGLHEGGETVRGPMLASPPSPAGPIAGPARNLRLS